MRNQIFRNMQSFLDVEVLNGVYVFTTDGCHLCTTQLDNLRSFPEKYDIIEVITKEDLDSFERMFNHCSFPFTVVYKDNVLVEAIKGLMFKTEMKRLNDAIGKKIEEKSIKFENVLIMTELDFEYCVEDCIKRNENPLVSLVNFIKDDTIAQQIADECSKICKKVILYYEDSYTQISSDHILLITRMISNGCLFEARKIIPHV